MEYEESSPSLPLLLNYPVHLNEDSISACSEPLTIMNQVTAVTAQEEEDHVEIGNSVISMTPILDESTVGSTFSQSQVKLSGMPEDDSRSSYDSFKTPLAVVLVHEEDSQSSLPKTPVAANMRGESHEEDSQGSIASQKSSSTGNKRRWDMVEVSERSAFPAENLFEYQWPLAGGGEYYILQEQISEFLGVKSFKRKYPDLQRRPVEMDEKNFLRERGVVTETQCDLGLTALRADEVIDLMVKDYLEKYQEYERILHEKEKRSINEKHRDYTAPRVEKSKMAEFIKKSVMSAAEWNSSFNRERKEERSVCFDLQTNIVHYPMGARSKPEVTNTISSIYPVALIPGQFQEFYKRYNEVELKYLPLNTVLYGPLKSVPPIDINSTSDGSQSDSDDSSCSGSSSESTRDGSGESNPVEKTETSFHTPVASALRKRKPPLKRKSLNMSMTRVSGSCRLCDQKVENLKDSIQCGSCQKIAHINCLHFTSNMVEAIKGYTWQCMDCKTCFSCRSATDEESLMFCDRCDRGYHTFCVGLKCAPRATWICGLCGHCGECGASKPGGVDSNKAQWCHQYNKLPNGEPVLKQILCYNCFSKCNFELNSSEDKKPVRLQLRMKRVK